MRAHILQLHYSGLLADHGLMDVANAERAKLGARRLLSASVYYFLHSYVPQRLATRTRDFEILEVAPSRGSWVLDLLIGIAASGVYDAIKVSFRQILIPAVREATAQLLASHGELWSYGTDQVALNKRVEPDLPMAEFEFASTARNSHPTAQFSAVHRHDDLLEITSRALVDVFNPLGRSAVRVKLLLDNETVIDVTAQHSFVTENGLILSAEFMKEMRRLQARHRQI